MTFLEDFNSKSSFLSDRLKTQIDLIKIAVASIWMALCFEASKLPKQRHSFIVFLTQWRWFLSLSNCFWFSFVDKGIF